MPKRRLKRGEGSVFYSKYDQTWFARVSLGTRNGKSVGRKVRAPTKADAIDELAKLNRLYVAGGNPSRQTLDEYLTEWLAGHQGTVRPSTATSYRGHIQLHISPLLGGILVGKLRPSDVRRLIADRQRAGLSPATIGRIVTTLKLALGQGVKERSLADNAAVGVPLPKVHREPVEALTEQMAADIIEATKDTFLGTLVVMLLGSGMRVGEACGLDWSDVGDGFVLVRRSKTTVRAVPISDDAKGALAKHKVSAKRVGPKVPVFLGPRGSERLSVATVSHAFPRMLEAAGLPRMTPHGLRHGAASLMVARGVHMRMVAQQLGHSNPALTARVYAHITPEASAEAVQVLNRRKA